MELPEAERPAFITEKRASYKEDVDIYKLASEMVVDGIVEPDSLRNELISRFNSYKTKVPGIWPKKCPVLPV
jgi:acetyl-CoA carboxylase carboxyltransferase component